MKRIKIIALPEIITGVLLYSMHYLLKENFYPYNYTPFRWYFGDILALIVSIPFFVNLQIVFMGRKYLPIGFNEILFWWFIFSIYYEILMPQKLVTMTGDPIDIIAYGLGGGILYWSQLVNKTRSFKLLEEYDNI
jgi:hypothetical protein